MARRWPKDLAWARVILEVDHPWCDQCGHRMYVCDHRHHRIFTLAGTFRSALVGAATAG